MFRSRPEIPDAEYMLRNWGFTYHFHGEWQTAIAPDSPFKKLADYFAVKWEEVRPQLAIVPKEEWP